MKFALSLENMVVSFEWVRFDKHSKILWFMVGDQIITSIDLDFYEFKFAFKGESSGAIFFTITRK